MYQVIKSWNGSDACVKRVTDSTFIPLDQSNTDYQRYLKWLDGYEEVNGEWVKTSDGNTPLPADE